MNAYATLGIEPRLVLGEEVLAEAFREAGKSAHPDAGGGDGRFSALGEARAVLASPSRRLRHWMELRGVALESRGSIDDRLMDLFSLAGEASRRAEVLARMRDDARSALARAMLEADTQQCREAVEQALAAVEAAIAAECAAFPDLEAAAEPPPELAARIARNLAFLEKWRTGLRASFSRLV
jgi:curved DNA-binding protein CbpA